MSEGSAPLLAGKTAIVTGGASGMGRATALLYAARGANVVIGDLDPIGGAQTVSLIGGAGGQATFMATDVSVAGQVEALVGAALDRYGRLDIAANVAGLFRYGGLLEAEEADWSDVIRVNLTGVFLCMKYEIAAMLSFGAGVIVNVSSIGGVIADPAAPAYTAAKHAVIGLGKSAALEFAHAGIRVNTVCPGFTRSKMALDVLGGELDGFAHDRVPLRRVGEPDDMAEAILWLSSDQSSYVTGSSLVVDGGATLGLGNR